MSEMSEPKKFYIECLCGQENLKFVFDEDEPILYINLLWDAFSVESESVVDKIKKYFKRLWFSFTGKEYTLYELVIDKKKLKEFKDFVASLEFKNEY